MRCPACSTTIPPGFKFCGNCGQSLTEVVQEKIAIPISDSSLTDFDTERRYVTVMFCDLVDSTVLSDHLDPEDTLTLLRQYHKVCGSFIEENDGHVAQYLGDGLLVYFGYPEAHEDDGVRAIQTALHICNAFEDLNSEVSLPEGFSLAVRIGIHTGEVVTASVGHGEQIEQLALGDVPNIAARLQGLAEPNTILVSEECRSTAVNEFEFEAKGAKTLKGVRTPVTVHSPIRSTSTLTRWFSGSVNPLVNREQALKQLQLSFEAAQNTGLQCLQITGPAGIGKSRLLLAFEQNLSSHQHHFLVTHCASGSHTSFLSPFANLIREWANISRDTPSEKQLELLQKIMELDLGSSESLEPFAELLNIPRDDHSRWLQGRPEDQKQQIFDALIKWVKSKTLTATLILDIEDYQWVDPSTSEILEQLVQQLNRCSLLLLTTQRLEDQSFISLTADTKRLDLAPLSAEHCQAILENVSGDMAAQLMKDIITRSDGVPLFVEEFARLASGHKIPGEAIPDRVRNLFTVRLDHLGPTKRIAVIAAVIGKEFTSELLRRVSECEPQNLKLQLDQLLKENIIARTSGIGVYVFVQHLMRDAIVANLIKSTLRILQGRIADILETHFSEEVTRQPERLARHWAQSNQPVNALPYFAKAADRPRSVYANAEAISLYQEAIKLADDHRDSKNLEAAEKSLLEMRENLGDVLALIHDYAGAINTFRYAFDTTSPEDNVRQARLLRKIGMAGRDSAPFGIPSFEQGLILLDRTPTKEQTAWYQEWAQLKFELSITHYQHGNLEKLTALVAEIEPVVRQHGTPHQQAELANQLLLVDQRRFQYSATEVSIGYSLEFVQAAKTSGDLPLFAAASSTRAFLLMEAGQFAAADTEFQQALEASVQAGYRTAQVRTLTYYTVLQRRRGNLTKAAKLNNQAFEIAAAADMKMYVCSAQSNFSWLAYRQHDLERAKELATTALTGWDQIGAQYPFRWIAWMPLAAVLLAQGDQKSCAEVVCRMLDSSQQKLHAKVMERMFTVSELFDANNLTNSKRSEQLHKANQAFVKIAGEHGYL